jgi:hypothetical protein
MIIAYIYSHRHNWLWGCNCRGVLQSWGTLTWLVVSTPPNNISQLGWLFPIYEQIKHVPNHQPVVVPCCIWCGKPMRNKPSVVSILPFLVKLGTIHDTGAMPHFQLMRKFTKLEMNVWTCFFLDLYYVTMCFVCMIQWNWEGLYIVYIPYNHLYCE